MNAQNTLNETEYTALDDALENASDDAGAVAATAYERQLVEQAQAGDPFAFDALQALYAPPIRRFVRRLVGDAELDDILQDVFLALYKNLSKIDPIEKLRPFLYRVARNRCYDELRRRGRYEISTLDEEPIAEWASLLVHDGNRPEDLAHWLLLHLQVQEAMQTLPELQRQALILYTEESMSYAEIADVMNVSIGTIKSRIYYAKRGLRQRLPSDVLHALDAEFSDTPSDHTTSHGD